MSDSPLPGLDDLHAHREPSHELEARVLDDYRQWVATAGAGDRGSGPRDRAWWTRPWAQAAAAVLFFAAGWGAGRGMDAVASAEPSQGDAPTGTVTGSSYIMLLWDGPDFAPTGDPASVAEAYGAWARSIAESGTPISGEELGLERALVGASSRAALASAQVGGFFMISGSSLDEVTRLAEAHPHTANGGIIEVAPIVDPGSR